MLRAIGTTLGAALRVEVQAYGSLHSAELKKLENNAAWAKLPKDKQAAILATCGICKRTEPDVGSDGQLDAELSACGLSHWRTLTDALPTRFEQALEKAIVENEPKAVRVVLTSATIRNNKDLEGWLTEARQSIEEALKKGPVIL